MYVCQFNRLVWLTVVFLQHWPFDMGLLAWVCMIVRDTEQADSSHLFVGGNLGEVQVSNQEFSSQELRFKTVTMKDKQKTGVLLWAL